MRIYVDASTLIALGTVGNLDLLSHFDGQTVVLPAVAREVTTQPAEMNLERFIETNDARNRSPATEAACKRALSVLDESERNGDVHLLACVLHHTNRDEPVGIVSDDRRVRTVSRGFGATVTGTIGVLVRAVEEGYDERDAKTLLRRIDSNGLHMTGELREKAAQLIADAAERSA